MRVHCKFCPEDYNAKKLYLLAVSYLRKRGAARWASSRGARKEEVAPKRVFLFSRLCNMPRARSFFCKQKRSAV